MSRVLPELFILLSTMLSWQSGLVSLQWLCGRDDVLFDLEKGQEIDDGRTASGVALALQVQQSPSAPVIRPHIKSSQPTYHPTMVALVVKKECEVERIRGGCFPCRVSPLCSPSLISC